MILARLSSAIRTQNWFAVALEFVIVIAGVVIGFQITAGAERSAMQSRMDRALVRLQVEVEQSAGMLAGLVDAYQRLNVSRTEAIERLLARDFENMDEDRLAAGLVAINLYPAFSPQQGVYEEIVSSGMLSSLGGDNESGERLRNALSRYQREVTFLQGQIDYMRDSGLAAPGTMDFPAVRLEYAPGTVRERRYVVDWQAAADDPELMQALLNGNNRMRATTDWWEDTLEAAIALCDAIAEHTLRPCEIVTEFVE